MHSAVQQRRCCRSRCPCTREEVASTRLKEKKLRFPPTTLAALIARYGGEARGEASVEEIVPLADARSGAVTPLFRASMIEEARRAQQRGAVLLVDASLATRVPDGPLWISRHATWVMAELLDTCEIVDLPPAIGLGCRIAEHVVLESRVVLGQNVVIGPSCVIGQRGFGWATGPDGRPRHIPHLGGVVIEDDVYLGALVTVDSGTLGPTIIRRGAKIDAHVHVGHNTEIGAGCMVAAQSGFAGSVRLGRDVMVGGQAGFADHVRVGDGARIAAKSGVIGDVPAGATFAGYPAMPRWEWLRAFAWLHRRSSATR